MESNELRVPLLKLSLITRALGQLILSANFIGEEENKRLHVTDHAAGAGFHRPFFSWRGNNSRKRLLLSQGKKENEKNRLDALGFHKTETKTPV